MNFLYGLLLFFFGADFVGLFFFFGSDFGWEEDVFFFRALESSLREYSLSSNATLLVEHQKRLVFQPVQSELLFAIAATDTFVVYFGFEFVFFFGVKLELLLCMVCFFVFFGSDFAGVFLFFGSDFGWEEDAIFF